MSESHQESLYHTRHSLLERIRDPNDEESWKEFVSYYEQYIYNILRAIKIPEADAKELCQDVIVKLWKKIPELAYDRDKGKFRHWLGVVIRNDANRYFNKTNRKNKILETTDQEELSESRDPNTSYDIEKVITEEWDNYIYNLAWKSIKGQFKESVQNVFIYHMQGKSTKEIAEACNITESTVWSYMTRIRNHLKHEVDKFNEELL